MVIIGFMAALIGSMFDPLKWLLALAIGLLCGNYKYILLFSTVTGLVLGIFCYQAALGIYGYYPLIDGWIVTIMSCQLLSLVVYGLKRTLNRPRKKIEREPERPLKPLSDEALEKYAARYKNQSQD